MPASQFSRTSQLPTLSTMGLARGQHGSHGTGSDLQSPRRRQAARLWSLALLPALTVLVTAAISVMPWRVPGFVAFGLPFLTLGTVFFWAERRPSQLLGLVVFSAGLMTDLVTDGPLGYWALLFLIGLALGDFTGRHWAGGSNMHQSWLGFALCLPLVAGFGWAIASLYYLTLLDLQLILYATAAGITGYLPLALALRSLGGEAGMMAANGVD